MSHRFYLPSAQADGDVLTLSEREAHHALHVVRTRVGDRITVMDGLGYEADCQVTQATRDAVRLRVLSGTQALRPSHSITLVQALPRGKVFDWILEKATELGATRVIPLMSERVVVHLDAAEHDRKLEKWRWILVDAMKQCGNPWLPQIEPPRTLEEAVDAVRKDDLQLVASLVSRAHPRDHFRAYEERHGSRPNSIAVWVGPEGDFSPGELERIARSGASSVTLGPLVLRAETAAIYCLSVLSYELLAAQGLGSPAVGQK